MYEMRHNIGEQHSGEKTSDVVIPVQSVFPSLGASGKMILRNSCSS